MEGESVRFNTLPAGHIEGWFDALKYNIRSFYEYIIEGKRQGSDPCPFATFQEGHYIMKIIDAIIKSSNTMKWEKV